MRKLESKFRILRAGNEQKPWMFEGLMRKRRGIWIELDIPVIRWKLRTGDYTIEGHINDFTIERKSVSDFVGTLFRGRDRFKRELGRMQEMKRSFIVVEGSIQNVLKYIRTKTQGNPDSIDATIASMMLDYPGTQWCFRRNRLDAMSFSYKLMELYLENLRRGTIH